MLGNYKRRQEPADLGELAKKHGALSLGEDTTEEIYLDANAVTEFVFGLARRSSRVESYTVLREIMPSYLHHWPALGVAWRDLLRLAFEECTTEQAQALWAAHNAAQRAP